MRINNIPKSIEMRLLAEHEFAKGFKKLQEDEFILIKKDRPEWKNCNKFLQLCYFHENDNINALITAERGKNRSFDIPILEYSEEILDFQKYFAKCEASKCAIIIFSDLDSYIFCWLIFNIKQLCFQLEDFRNQSHNN